MPLQIISLKIVFEVASTRRHAIVRNGWQCEATQFEHSSDGIVPPLPAAGAVLFVIVTAAVTATVASNCMRITFNYRDNDFVSCHLFIVKLVFAGLQCFVVLYNRFTSDLATPNRTVGTAGSN